MNKSVTVTAELVQYAAGLVVNAARTPKNRTRLVTADQVRAQLVRDSGGRTVDGKQVSMCLRELFGEPTDGYFQVK